MGNPDLETSEGINMSEYRRFEGEYQVLKDEQVVSAQYYKALGGVRAGFVPVICTCVHVGRHLGSVEDIGCSLWMWRVKSDCISILS
jgi:hypothetical protein